MGPQRSGCQDGVKPAGALLGVVPWKGNRREQEEGWTLRRKRLEEGGEARAKTGSHAAVAGRGCSGAPHVAATRVRRGETVWAGSPASCPQAPSQPRLVPPSPASCFWTPPVSRCLHPPLPRSSPPHLFQTRLISKAFSPPASLVISPPHFP